MPLELHSDLFPCIKCSAHFASREQQAEHLAGHDVELSWLCYRCPNALLDRTSYAEHMALCHPGRIGYCPCTKCRAPLTSQEILSRHIQHDHTGARGCSKCGFQNDSCLGISIHVLHEHAERCTFCGKGFINRVDVVLHMDGKGADGVCPERPKPRIPTPPPSLPPPLSAPPNETLKQLSPFTTPQLTFQTSRKPHRQSKPALPPLPDFIVLGRPDFSAADFDPSVIYESIVAPRKKYRDCPIEVPNEHLLNANPKLLAFGNLLRLAESYSNKDLFENINAGRPQPVFKTVQAIESRISAALDFTAENNGKSIDSVKTFFDRLRQKNGVRTGTRRAVKRETEEEHDVTSVAAQHNTRTLPSVASEHDAAPTVERSKTEEVPVSPLSPPPDDFGIFNGGRQQDQASVSANSDNDHMGSGNTYSSPLQTPSPSTRQELQHDTPIAPSKVLNDENL